VKIIGENSPWKKVEGKNEYTRTIKSNGNFKVSFEDLVGNIGKAELKIENVDLKVPTAKIEANIKEATKEDVILTLIPSEEIIILDENSNWVRIDGTNNYTLTISKNAEVIVNFKDLAGNENKANIKIDYIDKDAPKAEIKISTKETTNEEVTLTLVPSEEIIITDINHGWIKGEKFEYSKVINSNQEVIVNFTDLVGNSGVAKINVTNIDMIAPTAEIKANINEITNKDVILTFIPSEEIVILDQNSSWVKTEDKNEYTLTISENAEIVVNFKDLAGNIGVSSIKIDYIDKEKPTATIKANISDATKEDVILTLIPSEEIKILDENWVKVSDKNEYTLTVTKNSEVVVNYQDLAGNKGSSSIKIDYIDKEVPTALINANIESLTKEDVVLTLIPSEEIIILDENSNWVKVNDKNEYILTVTKNDEIVVNYKDLVGNIGVSSINIDYIDKEKPIAKIEASIKESTKEDVILTLIPSEEIIIKDKDTLWEKVEGSNNYTLTVKENGTYAVNYKDLAGNTGSTSISIDYIDKEAPLAQIKINTTNPTNQGVTLTLVPTEEIIISDLNHGWKKVSGKNEYKQAIFSNQEVVVNFTDLVGNIGVAKINVTNIDLENPIGEIKANIEKLTNKDIVLTLFVNEEIVISDENSLWERVDGENKYTLTINENGTFKVNYKDLAGNKGSSEITIENIDKEKPTAKIEASIKEATKEDVVLTLIPSEEIEILDENSKWLRIDETNNYTLTVSKNDKYVVNFKDLAGNIGIAEIIINNIDQEKPNAEIKANITTITKEDVVLTLIPNEEIEILDENSLWKSVDGENKYTLTINENGTFIVNYKDLVGNIGQSSITIDYIDKVKPHIEVSYNEEIKTNDFEIILEVDKNSTFNIPAVKVSDNYSDLKVADTKIIGEVNLGKIGTYEITYSISDEAKNTSTINLKVIVKDTTKPVIKLNGSKEITINYGFDYEELGASATDNYDEEVNVKVSSNINKYQVGSYKVVYKATDSSGNTTKEERTVLVVESKIGDLFQELNNCDNGKDCYNTLNENNYVWYSGYLWRVIKVNADETVKLVTEDSISGFSYDNDSSTFSGSHVEKWLNSDFYQSLNNASKIVVNANYCNELMTSLTKIRYSCSSSSTINSKVGLLTIDEYNILGGQKSFLNNGLQFLTMTPTTAASVWVVKTTGEKERGYGIYEPYGIRPVITISATNIVSGKGTVDNPFRIENDFSGSAGSLLTSRKSGEYVNFANHTWRIVRTTGTYTKLIMDSYLMNGNEYVKLDFGTVGTFSTSEGIGSYLHNNVYNSIFTSQEQNAILLSRWYYNSYGLGQNPKETTLVASANYTDAYVGLIRVGEIMSGSSSTSRINSFTSWTINSNVSQVWYSTWAGTMDYSSATDLRGIKPVINLNPAVTIASGTGTAQNPYELIY
ncbi:MAG: DUF5011 domain-containing protein, partial [Firmicutes bacterium]|nr:DUF5011 domain-containing protein [Bacillota bacterium]